MMILRRALWVTTALALTGCGFAEKLGASRAYNYATVLHSAEAKGVGLGAEAPFRASTFTLGVEAGAFRDSDNQSSAFALTHVDMDVYESETQTRNPRVGAFIGFVNDEERAKRFDDRYPVIGNFLPFVGVQVTVPTFGPHELRMRISPGYSTETAIFSIQSNFVF